MSKRDNDYAKLANADLVPTSEDRLRAEEIDYTPKRPTLGKRFDAFVGGIAIVLGIAFAGAAALVVIAAVLKWAILTLRS